MRGGDGRSEKDHVKQQPFVVTLIGLHARTRESRIMITRIATALAGRSHTATLAAAFTLVISFGAHAVGLPGQGTWETTLLGRDVNGNAVAGSDARAVFLYDTHLNITWLRDANYAKTSGFDADGSMSFNSAYRWADGLSIGGWSDWRLPQVFNGSEPCFGYHCTNSEMGYLWNIALGNYEKAGNGLVTINTGAFLNMQAFSTGSVYWSSQFAPGYASVFNMGFGNQGGSIAVGDGNTGANYAMAVRYGDVIAAPVPEPETWAIVLAGILFTAACVRHRRRPSVHHQGAAD